MTFLSKIIRERESVTRELRRDSGQLQSPRIYHHRKFKMSEAKRLNRTVDSDPAVQRYYEGLKGRRRSRGYISPDTIRNTHQSVRTFLRYLETPITDHAVSDLINQKRKDPSCTSTDDSLLVFSNLNPIMAHRNYATIVKGIFTRNGIRLYPKIDTHFPRRTQKISDGILKAIFLAQDTDKRTLMELQARVPPKRSPFAGPSPRSQHQIAAEWYRPQTCLIEHPRLALQALLWTKQDEAVWSTFED
jgi:hypothetical protein